jgi:hypothetical protein
MYPGVVAEKGEKGIVVKWDDGSEPSPALAGKIARVKAVK